MSRRHRAPLIAAGASLGLAINTFAQNVTWSNSLGGTFSVGSNWIGGVAPGASDTPVFNLNSTYNVLFNNSPGHAQTQTGTENAPKTGLIVSKSLS